MWTPQCVAPQDSGHQRSDDPARRKLRPIALEEALVKFVEGVACDAAIAIVLKKLEPLQLGAGTPDGTVLVVNMLREWAEGAVTAAHEGDLGQNALNNAAVLDELEIIFSTDLCNAYGNAFRSAMLRAGMGQILLFT